MPSSSQKCLQSRQGLFGAAEEVETPDGAAFDGARLGETVEGPDAGNEVIQTGEVFEVGRLQPRRISRRSLRL